MYTQSDYKKLITDSIDNYPDIAARYRANDPLIHQHLDAVAAMLSMHSQQIEIALAEPFEKTRESTVLADSAIKGIFRKSTPLKINVKATNLGNVPYVIDAGRLITDANGYPYVIDAGGTVPAGGNIIISATQHKNEIIKHIVTNSYPFYAIEVPKSKDGSTLSSISVSNSAGDIDYVNRYVNILPDERVFHIETDEKQRIYVRLGYRDVVGIQPYDGEEIRLSVNRSFGNVSTEYNSLLNFSLISSPIESLVTLTLDSVISKGIDPVSFETLRDISRYPSTYDSSAVFLGEFDFLIKRNHLDVGFLSVWNETIEERIRGVNVSNINALFIACFFDDESFLIEDEENAPLTPLKISAENYTDRQKDIIETIARADDSYRIYFYTPIEQVIYITIDAIISTSYSILDVKTHIKTALTNEYGINSERAKHGGNNPLYHEIYTLLKNNVIALSSGSSDFLLTVSGGANTDLIRPELWRYVHEDSINITIRTENTSRSGWGI